MNTHSLNLGQIDRNRYDLDSMSMGSSKDILFPTTGDNKVKHIPVSILPFSACNFAQADSYDIARGADFLSKIGHGSAWEEIVKRYPMSPSNLQFYKIIASYAGTPQFYGMTTDQVLETFVTSYQEYDFTPDAQEHNPPQNYCGRMGADNCIMTGVANIDVDNALASVLNRLATTRPAPIRGDGYGRCAISGTEFYMNANTRTHSLLGYVLCLKTKYYNEWVNAYYNKTFLMNAKTDVVAKYNKRNFDNPILKYGYRPEWFVIHMLDAFEDMECDNSSLTKFKNKYYKKIVKPMVDLGIKVTRHDNLTMSKLASKIPIKYTGHIEKGLKGYDDKTRNFLASLASDSGD